MQQQTYGATSRSIDSVEERRAALYEMMYLVVAVWLYVVAVMAPYIGLVAGLFLLLGGTHAGTKRVGKITLICAGVGFALFVAFVLLWVFLIGAGAAMR